MHTLQKAKALIGAIAMTTVSLPALADGPVEYADVGLKTVLGGTGAATLAAQPWVNLRFIDLGFVGGSGFDGVKNTVELQITTSGTLEPPPFNAGQLKEFKLTPYPTVGQVEGRGNLGSEDYVTTVYLNINEAAVPNFDFSKLQLVGTGPLGFPYPGAAPISAVIAKDGFAVGNAGRFDIQVSFGPGAALGPKGGAISAKLLFIYGGKLGEDSNIGLDLFDAGSVGGQVSYTAVATVWNPQNGGRFIGGAGRAVGSVAMAK